MHLISTVTPPSQDDDVLPGIRTGLPLKFSASRNALEFFHFFEFFSLRKKIHLWVSALRKNAPRIKDEPRLQKSLAMYCATGVLIGRTPPPFLKSFALT